MSRHGQILIVSDDAEFARGLVSRWRKEKKPPAITVVPSTTSPEVNDSAFEMIVLGPLHDGVPVEALNFHTDAVVCAVNDEETLDALRAAHRNWFLLPACAGWTGILFSFAREVLRRTAAERRAQGAEMAGQLHRRLGILGKSLLEARPGMVNALTSLLGNADLMLLSDERLPESCIEHVRTIHTMALRLNEIVQRLSSVENEMELTERKSHVETREIPGAEAIET